MSNPHIWQTLASLNECCSHDVGHPRIFEMDCAACSFFDDKVWNKKWTLFSLTLEHTTLRKANKKQEKTCSCKKCSHLRRIYTVYLTEKKPFDPEFCTGKAELFFQLRPTCKTLHKWRGLIPLGSVFLIQNICGNGETDNGQYIIKTKAKILITFCNKNV